MYPARLVPKPALVKNAYRELSIKIGPIAGWVKKTQIVLPKAHPKPPLDGKSLMLHQRDSDNLF